VTLQFNDDTGVTRDKYDTSRLTYTHKSMQQFCSMIHPMLFIRRGTFFKHNNNNSNSAYTVRVHTPQYKNKNICLSFNLTYSFGKWNDL